MKVDESTISVTFFLNKRMNPKSYGGKEWYPIYARIHFKGNNTKVKVLDRASRDIFSTVEKFEEFDNLYQGNEIERSFLKNSGGSVLDLLDCKEIYSKSLKYEWNNKKEAFSFSEYTAKLKNWQKGLKNILTEHLIEEITQVSKSHLDFNEFRNIDIEKIISDNLVFDNWFGFIQKDDALNPIRDLAESTIAYSQYIDEKFFSLSNYTGIGRPATYRGTVLSWLDGTDRVEFIGFLRDNHKEIFTRNTTHVSRYFCSNFRNYFKVDPRKALSYANLIQNHILKLD